MAEPVAGPPRRPTIRDLAERAGVSRSLLLTTLLTSAVPPSGAGAGELAARCLPERTASPDR
jgi:hypothetical protein